MLDSQETSPLVVTIGESLIDQVVQEDGSSINVVGGSPLNTALALSRQGYRASLVSRISKDELASMILEVLNESNVDTSKLIFCDEPTTRAIATPDGKGGKQYTFDIESTSQGTWDQNDLAGVTHDSNYVVITAALAAPIKSMREAFNGLFDSIKNDENKVIVFDPNVRPALISDIESVRSQLEEWISQSDVVKASMEDVLACWPNREFSDVAKSWMNLGAKLVVITDGEQGAHAFSENGSVFVKAVEVDPQLGGDTIGAGDTFTAGIVKYFIENQIANKDDITKMSLPEIESAVKAATILAGETCKKLGANPPWKDELETSQA